MTDEIKDKHVYFTCMSNQIYAVDCTDCIVLNQEGHIDAYASLEAYDELHGTYWWYFAGEIYPAYAGAYKCKQVINLTHESDIVDVNDRRFFERCGESRSKFTCEIPTDDNELEIYTKNICRNLTYMSKQMVDEGINIDRLMSLQDELTYLFILNSTRIGREVGRYVNNIEHTLAIVKDTEKNARNLFDKSIADIRLSVEVLGERMMMKAEALADVAYCDAIHDEIRKRKNKNRE